MDTLAYIANCIERILLAECKPSNHKQRFDDIAESLRIANNDGLDDAHQYLIDLCKKAEEGKYTHPLTH